MLLDNEFHGLLFAIAKKPQVFALMQNISVHLSRYKIDAAEIRAQYPQYFK